MASVATRRYAERFPERRLPQHETIEAVDQRFRKTGSVLSKNQGKKNKQRELNECLFTLRISSLALRVLVLNILLLNKHWFNSLGV
jgi:hypothetical protein